VPLLNTTEPPLPDVNEKPEPSNREPLPPVTVLPLLNTTTPLAPSDSDEPDDTDAAPDATDESPVLSDRSPLVALTVEPLAIRSDPDAAPPVVPVLSTSAPLAVVPPVFADRITSAPSLRV
jgi:hypothetical protein